jgi:arsenate reductase
MNDPTRVLVLCTGNSARSQMAEGLLRHRGGTRYQVFSAGINPSIVNPLAIEAIREVGIDISHHHSKSVVEFADEEFDYIITVCDNANENCPIFPGHAQRIHWSFDDPAMAEGSQKERLSVFRRVRDEIAARISEFLT